MFIADDRVTNSIETARYLVHPEAWHKKRSRTAMGAA